MFTNNYTLCRLIFRRDWLRILFWFIGIAMLVIGFGSALPNLFGTEEGRESMLVMMDNPAMVAMIGPVYLKDGEFTLGAMYSLFMVVWTGAGMAIMNIFHVTRHTRQDEERGRIEVIRSLPVGRLSNLSATLTSAVIINAVFALLLGLGLFAVGHEGMDFNGSMLFGAAMGAVGLVFAAVTAVFCQMSANPRTAMSFSFAFLLIAYMVRAMGDMRESEAISLVSPLGLIYRTRIYTDNEWWPVFVSIIITIAVSAIAFMLCRTRDMGEGLLAARAGRKDAKPYLKSPGGLSWRLLKTPFIVWSITVPVLGMSYGSIMGDIDSFIESTPVLIKLTDGNSLRMVGFIMVIMSMVGTIPVLQFVLKARTQESGGYAENVLARSVSKHSQLFGYFLIALISSVLMPFLNCLGFWLSSSVVMDTPFEFMAVFNACMVYVPAILFMLGVAMILIGWLPKYTGFVYAYLGYSFAMIYLGNMMGLPEWLGKLSPFGHVPQLPLPVGVEIQTVQVVALIAMPVLAVLMFVISFIGYQKRDMKFS